MYDGITNIIKVNQTREYLSQRGVSPKILLNPRSYEGIEKILEEVPFIRLDSEAALRLNERIQIKNGNMQMKMSDGEKVLKMAAISCGMTLIKENWSNDILSKEKRIFNNDGIEIKRNYENAIITYDEWENGKIDCLPFIRIQIQRDENRPDLLQKIYQKAGFPIVDREFYQRKKFLNFHDVWIGKKQRNRFSVQENDIFLDLGNEELYESIRKENFQNLEEGIKEYKLYNKKYGLTKMYQTGIEKLCLKGKMIGGR